MPDEARIAGIMTLPRDRLLPLIERGGPVDGPRELLGEAAIPGYLLTGGAQTVLG